MIPSKAFFLVGILSLVGVAQAFLPAELLNKVIDTTLSPPVTPQASSLDRVTYILVDTTLSLMQIGKFYTLDYYGDPPNPEDPEETIQYYLDWTFNTTRVRCPTPQSCAQEDIYMDFKEPVFTGVRGMHIYTDFQPSSFNFSLIVDKYMFESVGYHHEIRSNLTKSVRMGEGSKFELLNSTYAISANYSYVPGLGVQVSNVDITLNIGVERWTVQNTYTVLENGFIIDGGLHVGDLSDGVMQIWNGVNEGKPFEQQYEEWAEFLLNCGLSGGKSSPNCEDAKPQREILKTLLSS